MATKRITLCDMTGAELPEGSTPVVLKLVNGDASFHVALDLSDDAKAKLVKALMPYAKAGRDAGPVISPAPKSASKSDPIAAAARKWAKENGREIGDKGRVPQAIVDEYRASDAYARDFPGGGDDEPLTDK